MECGYGRRRRVAAETRRTEADTGQLHGARVLLENLKVTQLVRKLQALYGTLSFVPVFLAALRGTASCAR
jgi:hypothetical protein